MHLSMIVRRDAPGTEGYANSSCSGTLSWFRWCPVDIILWALIFLAVSLCCWKIYRSTQSGEGTHLRQMNDRRYKRLMLPYRADPSPAYKTDDDFESQYWYDREKQTSIHVDPYHVVNNIDDSLISKDARFNGASVPQAVLDQKKSGRVSGMGLGLGLNILERTSPKPEHIIEPGSEHKHARLLTPPPPPAYVHNARWDHV